MKPIQLIVLSFLLASGYTTLNLCSAAQIKASGEQIAANAQIPNEIIALIRNQPIDEVIRWVKQNPAYNIRLKTSAEGNNALEGFSFEELSLINVVLQSVGNPNTHPVKYVSLIKYLLSNGHVIRWQELEHLIFAANVPLYMKKHVMPLFVKRITESGIQPAAIITWARFILETKQNDHTICGHPLIEMLIQVVKEFEEKKA